MKSNPDRTAALELVPVSRETEQRLAIFVDLLARWRKITNLISAASFEEVWRRHIADSAQLLALAPRPRDGSTLIRRRLSGMVRHPAPNEPGALVHLIERPAPCASWRESRATSAIHAARIQSMAPESLMPVDAVTARACALPALIDFAKVWLAGAIGVFPRGMTEAQLDSYSMRPIS